LRSQVIPVMINSDENHHHDNNRARARYIRAIYSCRGRPATAGVSDQKGARECRSIGFALPLRVSTEGRATVVTKYSEGY
jgi:hypothetical protein